MTSSPTELVINTLSPAERETVTGWLNMLGLEPDELAAAPAILKLAEMMAVLRLAADMPDLRRGERITAAAEALGLRPATIRRRWYRMQEAAVRHFVTETRRAA
jgi:hypothetical protein